MDPNLVPKIRYGSWTVLLIEENYVNVYLWPRYKVALDGHASPKEMR